MKVGIHDVEFGPRPTPLRQELKDIAQYADANGFDSISVMDHFFQIGMIGAPELNMLEAYTTLAFFAGITERIRLLALVTGVSYRHPGVLAKTVSTLDVLSGGRAMLGIGAAWNEQEAVGLGIPFPPLKERFEMLEETLQIIHQMWAGDVTAFNGKHYQLAKPINAPQPVTKPHPPILIGGSGEKKTLRLVAKYGDACNLFWNPDTAAVQHKLDVLKQHCDDVGRDFSEIELTVATTVRPGTQPSSEIVALCRAAADLGFRHMMFMMPDMYTIRPLEILAKEVIPEVSAF